MWMDVVKIDMKKCNLSRHVKRRPVTEPVRKGLAMKVDGPPKGRGRPKTMWMEVIKIDMKKCNLSDDTNQDR